MLAPFVDPFFPIEQPTSPLPMVGRTWEIQMLAQLLSTVSSELSSGARALTISGEMGIGKSFLLAQTVKMAHEQGFRVLEMRGYSSSQVFPFFPFIEVLRQIFRSRSLEGLRFLVGLPHSLISVHEPATQNLSLTGVPLVSALARLFPELPASLHVQVLSELMPADQEKFRLFDALATIFERLALEQPLLLCIDNLQWLDRASLELLFYLIIRLRTNRVALLGATRPTSVRQEEIEQDEIQQRAERSATHMLTELMQQGLWYPLPLSPLSAETMNEHLQALLPGELSEELAQLFVSRAEGNPFFLEELVRTCTLNKRLFLHKNTWTLRSVKRIDLPESIIAAVRQRLQFLSPDCLELLSIAALFGRSFPADALSLVISREGTLEEGQIEKLLNEGLQTSIIAKEVEDIAKEVEDAAEQASPQLAFPVVLQRYTFCQGIFQEILQHELPVRRVRLLHQFIAQALEQCYGQEAPRHAGELAAHYVASNDRSATLYWSLLAGEEAMQQQAYQRAIEHFQLAMQLCKDGVETLPGSELSVPTSIELALTIGELWFRLGELQAASTILQSALESSELRADFLQARINRMLADIYRLQAKYEQALSHLQAAQALFVNMQPVSSQSRVPWFFTHSPTLTVERLASAEQILVLQAQATLSILLNRAAEAETALWQAHQLATQLGDRSSQAFSLHLIGWIYGWGERIHETLRLQQQAHALYLSIGDPFRATLGAQGFGIIYQSLGEMEVARSHTQRGLDLAQKYGVLMVVGWLYWNQGVQALMQGRWEESASWLQQAYREAKSEENARLLPVVLQAQALLQFKRGLWQEAEQHFQDALQASTNTDWFVSTVALYGHFLAVTGRRAQARIQLERARALPEPIGFSGSFFIPFLVEGYLHLDTYEQAQAYNERLRGMSGFLYYGLAVDRVLGELAILAQNWEIAEQAFENGLQLCRRAQNQPEVAAILYEQARMSLIRGEDEAVTRRLCEEARALFVEYEMQRMVAQINTLLAGIEPLASTVASPIDPRSLKPKAERLLHMQLTPREREVLQLVAEGNIDREVADILVLSHRTVHRHLSNIFVKLGVPGRAAAVAYAIRNGLV
jgi:DNA-binding NarL/FixJ family response regulator